jgi:hypothetical protein
MQQYNYEKTGMLRCLEFEFLGLAATCVASFLGVPLPLEAASCAATRTLPKIYGS